jgi:hypothetical protein
MNGLFNKEQIIYNSSNVVLSNDYIGDLSMNKNDKDEYDVYHSKMIISSRSNEFDKAIYDILGAKVGLFDQEHENYNKIYFSHLKVKFECLIQNPSNQE